MNQTQLQKPDKQKLTKRIRLQADSDEENDSGPKMKMRSIHEVMGRSKPAEKIEEAESILREREKLIAAAQKKPNSEPVENKAEFDKRDVLLANDVEGITYTKDEAGHIKISVQGLQREGEVTRAGVRRRPVG
jgi:hypothetical protein